MGWQDREYNWDGEGSYGEFSWRPPTVTAWLLGLHVVSFVLLQSVTLTDLSLGVALSPFGYSPEPWRGVLALITVVFVFLFLGARIERSDGPGRVLTLYFAGTLGGIIGHLGIALLAPHLAGLPIGPVPNGAFAAFAMFGLARYRDEPVSFFGYPRTVAWVIGLLSLLTIGFQFWRMGPETVGWLVGVFAGGITATFLDGFDPVEWWSAWRAAQRRKAVVRPSIPKHPPPDPEPDPNEGKLDDLLAKISREGFDALTEAEREELEEMRARLQDRS